MRRTTARARRCRYFKPRVCGGLVSTGINPTMRSRCSRNYRHTMETTKVAIAIPKTLLRRVDGLVKRRVFPNRSKAIQQAVREKLERIDRSRLARECAKLDPKEEQAMAEEGM